MPRPPNSPSAGRFGALEGLRGLAALAVLVLHAWLYTTSDSGDLSAPADAIAHELRLGLVLFFVLSGFLLWRSWLRPHPDGVSYWERVRHFAVRRAARVLPAYYLALVGAIVIVLATGEASHMPPPEQIPLFLGFAQNLSAATLGKLDPPMWTLAVEVCFYATLPLLALALRGARRPRLRSVLVAGWLLAAGTAYNILVSDGQIPPTTLVNQLPALAPTFACGMLAATFLGRRPLPRPARALLLAAGALLVVGDGAWHSQVAVPAQFIVRDLPAAAGFACVLLALARAPRPGMLATRPLRALGNVSYGLYLWHMPMIFALRGLGVWPSFTPLAVIVLLVPSLLLATASWRWIERPVMRALRPPPGARSRPSRHPVLTPAPARGG